MTEWQALTFVEVDIPVCELVHGTAPCTATGAGDARCWNCLATCQDEPNYSESEVTLRFAEPGLQVDQSGIEAIPCISSVDLSPAMISLGEDLGQRASLTVSFHDLKWSDTGPGFDPYHAGRSYDPYSRGTFWGKFRSRQPYLRGRAIRVIRGFLGQALEAMETRHYVIDSFDGPDADGSFRIIAKDVLKLLDGDRAQAPLLSNGFLAGDITNTATTATLSPTGIGNDEYAASGKLAIGGKEIVSFTRSGDTLTFTARGLNGTTAQAHKAQDRVQTVLEYSAENAADILYDLGVNYAGVPSSQIDLPAWQTEVTSFNARLYSAVIAEPTPVKTLYSELIEQAGLALWGDEINQKIRLQVLRQIATDAEAFGDENRLREQFEVEEQPDRRLSRVWTYYGKINPLAQQDDPNNYRQSAQTVDLDAEANYGSAAIKVIYSRWIPDGGRAVAQRLNNILLGRFTTPPRRVSFPLFRVGPETPTLGEGCLVSAWPLQDASGAREQVPVQIVRLGVTDTEWRVVADELRFTDTGDDPSVRDIAYDADINGVNLRTKHDALYPAPLGGETVNLTLEQAAVLGSSSVDLPALIIGDWPTVSFSGTLSSGSGVIAVADTSAFKVGQAVTGAGIPNHARVSSIVADTSVNIDKNATASGAATLTLHTVILNVRIRGRVQGPGGRGGRGARWNPTNDPGNGERGGTALYTRTPINLLLDEGLARLWGGGGGGGGVDVLNLNQHWGGGGGGGAGIPGGPGGYGYGTGATGSRDAGGIGGDSYASYNWASAPRPTGVRGGQGGAPGQSGNAGGHHGGNSYERDPGDGGPAGYAIDGTDYCRKTGTGDLLGSEI